MNLVVAFLLFILREHPTCQVDGISFDFLGLSTFGSCAKKWGSQGKNSPNSLIILFVIWILLVSVVIVVVFLFGLVWVSVLVSRHR